MKSLTSTILSGLVALLMLCCQEKSEVSVVGKLEKADEITKTHGGSLFEGQVSITTDAQGSLIGKFETDDASKTFTLQNGQKSNNLKSGQYQLLYLKHVLLLNNLTDGKKYLLTVNNDESRRIVKSLPSSYTKNTSILNGVGLSLGTRSLFASMNETVGGDGCASAGGQGSTSCSNACCSVSCSGGYYASCGNSCGCMKG